MTAYQFSQPWLSKLGDPDWMPTAQEFAHLRKYLKGIDDGTISLFNLNALNSTISNLTVAGNIAMGGFKLTGLGAGSTNGDSLRYEQLIGLYLLLTGGTMSGAIAMGSNKITGLAAASANGDAVRFEQISGKRILQIVQATTTTDFTSTSATFEATNLSASITPASTASTVLVFASAGSGLAGNTNDDYITLYRGSTNLGGANGFFVSLSPSGTGTYRSPATVVYLDSPASASSQTYAIKIRNDTGAAPGVYWGTTSETQVMILIEVG